MKNRMICRTKLKQAMISSGRGKDWKRGVEKKCERNCFSPRGKSGNLARGRKEKTFRTHRQGPTFLAFQTAAGFCSPQQANQRLSHLSQVMLGAACHINILLSAWGYIGISPASAVAICLPFHPSMGSLLYLSSGHWFGDRMGPLRLLFLYRRPSREI
ncbi:uncharacterized protein BO66DRAFT_90281 [Aspergillus aculeatinus CBS 121060]|uniref:Uncharacterized protein n=1 Tax=Aspergillus aculeatinus CBS 121060 TaxID=1448322 RepID=A0ACD1H996_9EURO|nr:hypothetical protein BO66DRAFT_90281 [Aspergillus aculeatinus CBS 121060]RAH70166.1 hypothetical protein BO66DRAFT_90281 [Aspergillus aculeatinus CBS 121060]